MFRFHQSNLCFEEFESLNNLIAVLIVLELINRRLAADKKSEGFTLKKIFIKHTSNSPAMEN